MSDDLDALLRREFVLDADLVHLNHAGVAPWPRSCADAVSRFAQTNARRSYAGQFGEWMVTEHRLRERLARLIGTASADDIALLKNTSDGLSQVAHGLSWDAGDQVVALAEEFISNRLTWEALGDRGVAFILVTPRSDESPEDALEAACGGATRLMTVSSVQYGTGYRMDLARLGRFCQDRDILFCVDAIQSLGALRFDVAAVHADFVISGAHKWLMSPFGIAMFYCRQGLRDLLRPLAFGWHSLADPMRFAGTLAELESSARRYEAGTANLAAVMGFEATLAVFEAIGADRMEARVLANARHLADRLTALPGVRLLSPIQGPHLSGNVCIALSGLDHAAAAARLEMEYGILCAARGPSLRFSPHGYQGPQELDRAVDALAQVLK